MPLRAAQRRSLLHRGYAILPGGAAPDRVTAALKAINASLGRGLAAADIELFRSQSFCPELRAAPVITDLFHETAARPLAESLLGPELEPVAAGQIALAFPAEEPPAARWPHLDGLHTPTNGVPEGTVQTFTMLVGVALSDQTEPGSGNLVVWPGSHLLYAEYFARHGGQCLLKGLPDLALPDPQPVLVRAGDLVLCHYQLAHAGGPNTSARVRYSVYFRVRRAGHEERRWRCLEDPWLEWAGLAAEAPALREA